LDGDSLRVKGDPVLQDAIAQLLNELADAVDAESEFEVRVIEGAAFDVDAPLVLDEADADAREQAMASAGLGRVVRCDRARAGDGSTASIFDSNEAPCLRDWEV